MPELFANKDQLRDDGTLSHACILLGRSDWNCVVPAELLSVNQENANFPAQN